MSRNAPVNLGELARFPRVSGDEPAITGEDADFVQFSPRERG